MLKMCPFTLKQLINQEENLEISELQRSCSQSQEGEAGAALNSCGFDLMSTKEWQAQGVAQRSVHFQVTHSGVYCPVPQLNDVMFHLRLLVMLKSVVCSLGGKRH